MFVLKLSGIQILFLFQMKYKDITGYQFEEGFLIYNIGLKQREKGVL